MDNQEYRTDLEFASDVQPVLTSCYKYNPPDHGVVTMEKKLQDVIETRFVKTPDEPLVTTGAPSAAAVKKTSSGSSSESDDSEDERARKVLLLQDQLKAMQEQMKKLVDESIAKKKKKTKHKDGSISSDKTVNTSGKKSKKSTNGGKASVGKSGAGVLVNDATGGNTTNITLGSDVKLASDTNSELVGNRAFPVAPSSSKGPKSEVGARGARGAEKGAKAQNKRPKTNSKSTNSKKKNAVLTPLFDSEDEDNAKPMSYDEKMQLSSDTNKIPE